MPATDPVAEQAPIKPVRLVVFSLLLVRLPAPLAENVVATPLIVPPKFTEYVSAPKSTDMLAELSVPGVNEPPVSVGLVPPSKEYVPVPDVGMIAVGTPHSRCTP